MAREELLDFILEHIAQYTGEEEISLDEETTFEELKIDNLEKVEMAAGIEERFDIFFDPGDLVEMQTIGEFVELACRLLSEGGAE